MTEQVKSTPVQYPITDAVKHALAVSKRGCDELLVEKLKQRDLYSKVRVSDADITQAIDSLPEKDKKKLYRSDATY